MHILALHQIQRLGLEMISVDHTVQNDHAKYYI